VIVFIPEDVFMVNEKLSAKNFLIYMCFNINIVGLL